VDFISAHAYYDPSNQDLSTFLRSSEDMDRFITTVVGIADEVAVARGSDKRIAISFDEWNVWRMSTPVNPFPEDDDWPVAPHLLEDVYTAADAVVVGSLLITLLRHADRVRAASLAQLVNVIAPIMTEPGGRAWRQTTFYPFAITARLAGATVLASDRPSEFVDAVATLADDGSITVFAVNLDPDSEHKLTVAVAGEVVSAEVTVLTNPDPLATNTADAPDRVTPASGRAVVDGDNVTVQLPAVSWAAVRLTLA
jgi:alpha-N-arabinofuranosidase